VFDLVSLKTLLKSDRERAKEVLLALKKDAKEVEGMIQEEMEKRFGFRWAIWMGFHAAPSVE
jgi:aprataxin